MNDESWNDYYATDVVISNGKFLREYSKSMLTFVVLSKKSGFAVTTLNSFPVNYLLKFIIEIDYTEPLNLVKKKRTGNFSLKRKMKLKDV